MQDMVKIQSCIMRQDLVIIKAMMTHDLSQHKLCQQRHTCKFNFISSAVLGDKTETMRLLLQAKKQHGEGQVAKAELQQAHQEALQALHATSARAQEAATAAQQQSAAADAGLRKMKGQLLTHQSELSQLRFEAQKVRHLMY